MAADKEKIHENQKSPDPLSYPCLSVQSVVKILQNWQLLPGVGTLRYGGMKFRTDGMGKGT
jgi:hypothetical protein